MQATSKVLSLRMPLPAPRWYERALGARLNWGPVGTGAAALQYWQRQWQNGDRATDECESSGDEDGDGDGAGDNR